METWEFIRRIRRYALHRDMHWLLVDGNDDDRITFHVEDRTASLHHDIITEKDLDDALHQLGINPWEF